ncbi:MAG: response regulator [Candidatus Lokiarchaeota archaeon]|nr:response regulator [Candidatus Lokiarchaeota archaeon]
MSPIVMIVDDNKEILFNIKLLLEFNDYHVITAENGKEAIDKLSNMEKIPDVIISDIMMPKMDGYNFFEHVSEHPVWYHIPFIFLTAKSEQEDVRIGKSLGADDYIKKPFKEEDLLAIIKGKIRRKAKAKSLNKDISKMFKEMGPKSKEKISKEKDTPILLYMVWHYKLGPKLISYYPKDTFSSSYLKEIGNQLFKSHIAIYGRTKITKPESLLLNIRNIEKDAYIYFNSIPDDDSHGNRKDFMLSFIAPSINYIESLKVQKIFQTISNNLLTKEKSIIDKYWEKILRELKWN